MKFFAQSLALACCSILLAFSMQSEYQQTATGLLNNTQSVCIKKTSTDDVPPLIKTLSAPLIRSSSTGLEITVTKDKQFPDKFTCLYRESKSFSPFNDVLEGELMSLNLSDFLDSYCLVLLLLAAVPLSSLVTWRREDRVEPSKNVGERICIQVRVPMDQLQLKVHEQPIATSRVLHSFTSGSVIFLTGKCDNDWLEVVGGGWVFSRHLEFTNIVGRLPD